MPRFYCRRFLTRDRDTGFDGPDRQLAEDELVEGFMIDASTPGAAAHELGWDVGDPAVSIAEVAPQALPTHLECHGPSEAALRRTR